MNLSGLERRCRKKRERRTKKETLRNFKRDFLPEGTGKTFETQEGKGSLSDRKAVPLEAFAVKITGLRTKKGNNKKNKRNFA